jgi:hypothetical protein
MLCLFQITLCKNLLVSQFNGEKGPAWRNLCSTVIGESVSTLIICKNNLLHNSMFMLF